MIITVEQLGRQSRSEVYSMTFSELCWHYQEHVELFNHIRDPEGAQN